MFGGGVALPPDGPVHRFTVNSVSVAIFIVVASALVKLDGRSAQDGMWKPELGEPLERQHCVRLCLLYSWGAATRSYGVGTLGKI